MPDAPLNELSRSLVPFACDATVIAAVELSKKTWLVGGIMPGINRHPEKKIDPDEQALLRLLYRWRDEAGKAGHTVTRIAVALEAGRDGFWLARWLRARGIEAQVIHPTSIPVSREHRRAKTDRLGYRLAQTCLPRLATRRARALQHGRDPYPRRGGCQASDV